MSDPVTNVDVEDVLSSIRRLVSNNEEKLHPAPKPENAQDKASETPASDALVLTSALRVSDPATEPEAEDVDTSDSGAVLDNLRSALSGQEASDEYEDSEEDDIAEHVDDEAQWQVDPAEDDSDDHQEESESTYEWSSDRAKSEQPVLNDYADLESDGDDAQAVTEASEEASHEDNNDEDHSAEQAEESWSVPEDEGDDAQEEPQAEAAADEIEYVEASEDQSDASEDHDQTEDHHESETIEAEAENHDDEPVEEAQIEEVETDQDDHDDAETVFSEPDDPQAPAVDLADFDETVIDEEMLRDLVAEIVRQELTGALGERITRNVRKLVRREIHRAMLTRDFD